MAPWYAADGVSWIRHDPESADPTDGGATKLSDLRPAPGYEIGQRTRQRSNALQKRAISRPNTPATAAREPMACPRCRVRYDMGSECPDCRVELVGESYIDTSAPRSARPDPFDWLFSHLVTVVIVLAGVLLLGAVLLQLVVTAWKTLGV